MPTTQAASQHGSRGVSVNINENYEDYDALFPGAQRNNADYFKMSIISSNAGTTSDNDIFEKSRNSANLTFASHHVINGVTYAEVTRPTNNDTDDARYGKNKFDNNYDLVFTEMDEESGVSNCKSDNYKMSAKVPLPGTHGTSDTCKSENSWKSDVMIPIHHMKNGAAYAEITTSKKRETEDARCTAMKYENHYDFVDTGTEVEGAVSNRPSARDGGALSIGIKSSQGSNNCRTASRKKLQRRMCKK